MESSTRKCSESIVLGMDTQVQNEEVILGRTIYVTEVQTIFTVEANFKKSPEQKSSKWISLHYGLYLKCYREYS